MQIMESRRAGAHDNLPGYVCDFCRIEERSNQTRRPGDRHDRMKHLLGACVRLCYGDYCESASGTHVSRVRLRYEDGSA